MINMGSVKNEIFIFLLFPVLVCADYQYKGFLSSERYFLSLCESCFLDLPVDYLKSEIYLNVSTNKKKGCK